MQRALGLFVTCSLLLGCVGGASASDSDPASADELVGEPKPDTSKKKIAAAHSVNSEYMVGRVITFPSRIDVAEGASYVLGTYPVSVSACGTQVSATLSCSVVDPVGGLAACTIEARKPYTVKGQSEIVIDAANTATDLTLSTGDTRGDIVRIHCVGVPRQLYLQELVNALGPGVRVDSGRASKEPPTVGELDAELSGPACPPPTGLDPSIGLH